MKVTIYHNPRCSKSRQTLEILQSKNLDIEIIEYLKNPPDKKTLTSILSKLKKRPNELLRRGESEYKDLSLADKLDDDDELINTMIQHPILIERPIVVSNNSAVIGRPPESVNEII